MRSTDFVNTDLMWFYDIDIFGNPLNVQWHLEDKDIIEIRSMGKPFISYSCYTGISEIINSNKLHWFFKGTIHIRQRFFRQLCKHYGLRMTIRCTTEGMKDFYTIDSSGNIDTIIYEGVDFS